MGARSPLIDPYVAEKLTPVARATVVYLDDDPVSRELLVEFFRLLPELDLVTARTAHEARAAIIEHRPAIVVSDAWMGDVSSDRFVIEILSSPRLEAPAVVILSADANASTIARFRRLGVSTYLPKPIELCRLSDVLHELARTGELQNERIESNARSNAASGN